MERITDRHQIDKDGDLYTTAKVPFPTIADLPRSICNVAAEVSEADISDRTRADFALMLSALAHLHPDEIEMKAICRALDRR